MLNTNLWKKQVKLSQTKKSPLFKLLKNVDNSSFCCHCIETAFIKEQMEELGYIKLPFLKLRDELINNNLKYDLDKLLPLIKNALPVNYNEVSIQSIADMKQDKDWLYYQNIVEYVNIRSLGVNDSSSNALRSGTFLDLIVYMLQSRSCVFHLAPFHNCSMDQLYTPKDTYSISKNLVSEELLELGFSPEEQLKIVLDFGHLRREKNAFFIDVMPHTGDLSVNYLYKPNQARWISLNKEYIEEKKKYYNKGAKLIRQAADDGIESVDDKELKDLFNLSKDRLKKLVYGRGKDLESNYKNIVKEVLGERLALATNFASNQNDVKLLQKKAVQEWGKGNNAELSDMVESKDSFEVRKKVKSLITKKLGKSYSYEDVQASERDYKGSITKQLREKEFIYNIPVGAWDGGELEFIGFHIKHYYPIFVTRSTNGDYVRNRDVSSHVFGTISRRNFRLPDGNLNQPAMDEFVNAYHYWIMLGFDGMRLDQVNHLYYKTFDYDPESAISMAEYFAERGYSYDTMLAEDIAYFINALRSRTSKYLNVLLEDMMHYPIPASNRMFKHLKQLKANTIIGNFQFMETMPKLLLRIQQHNLIKLYQQTGKYSSNTIECHDNNLTFGGTSPVCKSADGIVNFRIRFLINLIGLPHITTQAFHVINYAKATDSLMQQSVNSIKNMNFSDKNTYSIGDQIYSFDDFRHNIFDFYEKPEINSILKGGIIEVINSNRITENSQNGLLFFTVYNKSDDYILFVVNASYKLQENVWLANTNLDWYEGDRKAVKFDLDQHYKSKLIPEEVTLTMLNESGNRQALCFGDLAPGEIQTYLIKGIE